jgi:hypothetical protein
MGVGFREARSTMKRPTKLVSVLVAAALAMFVAYIEWVAMEPAIKWIHTDYFYGPGSNVPTAGYIPPASPTH